MDLYGLPPLVVTAYGARVMGPAHSPALRTAREPGELESQVAAALALTRLRIAFLWQWGHLLFLPFHILTAQGGESGPAAVYRFLIAVAVALVQVVTAFGA